MNIKDKLASQMPEYANKFESSLKESSDVVVGEVTIGQIYGGMRDVKGLVTDISYVDPVEAYVFVVIPFQK